MPWTRALGSNAITRKCGLNLAGWIVTCAIAASLCAEFGISGDFSIASPEAPELRRQAWFELSAIALLPLLLQLGIRTAKRILRTAVPLETMSDIDTMDWHQVLIVQKKFLTCIGAKSYNAFIM